MATQFEARFSINRPDGQSGVTLLKEATERIREELLSSATDEGAPDVETGATGASGYTRISAERNYPSAPEHRMRLEVRLCTKEGGLDAEVQSRFLSTIDATPTHFLAGPPRLLQFIAGEFLCSVGLESVHSQFRRIAKADIKTFVKESVLNSQRRLPILAVSEDRYGTPSLDPDRAQRTLLGVASVAVLEKEATSEMTRHLGRWFSSANGSLQVLWPGCRADANGEGPRVWYSRDTIAKMNGLELLRELQQLCMDNTPDSDFDSAFSDARVSVILERNRLLEAQQALPQEEAATTVDQIKTAERELRKARLAEKQTGRMLEKAQSEIVRLEHDLAKETEKNEELSASSAVPLEEQVEREITRKLRAENRELRGERDKLRDTNARLNQDNQLLRQQERRNLDAADVYVIRLAYPHPGNVTILNYALNLYRDPMRRYIVRNLDARDDESLKEILRMSVEFNTGTREKPEALIDVNDFHNIVTDNRSYFDESRNLAWILRQIKDVRNKAAHPPPGGITADYMQDGLTRIAEALEVIGADQELLEVRRLRDRIYSN